VSSGTHDIQKESKKYLIVFGGLLILTVITVLASNLKIGVTVGVTLALIIASIKGGLVACCFMHLSSEKRPIYLVLILTAIFFICMLFLIFAAHYNLPEGAHYVS